jgi:hypothetical protein
MWDLWWKKWHGTGSSPCPLVSPCQYYYTNAPYSLMYAWEKDNGPVRSWSSKDSVSLHHTKNKKKEKIIYRINQTYGEWLIGGLPGCFQLLLT